MTSITETVVHHPDIPFRTKALFSLAELLAAWSSFPPWVLSSAQNYTLFPRTPASNDGWSKGTKAISSGQLWRAMPVAELPVELAELSVTTYPSWNIRVITIIVGFCKLSAFRISANTLISTNPIIRKTLTRDAQYICQWILNVTISLRMC